MFLYLWDVAREHGILEQVALFGDILPVREEYQSRTGLMVLTQTPLYWFTFESCMHE